MNSPSDADAAPALVPSVAEIPATMLQAPQRNSYPRRRGARASHDALQGGSRGFAVEVIGDLLHVLHAQRLQIAHGSTLHEFAHACADVARSRHGNDRDDLANIREDANLALQRLNDLEVGPNILLVKRRFLKTLQVALTNHWRLT